VPSSQPPCGSGARAARAGCAPPVACRVACPVSAQPTGSTVWAALWKCKVIKLASIPMLGTSTMQDDEPCPEAATLSPVFPRATASCPDLLAVSSDRAAPDSEAVGGLANETRRETGSHMENGSECEAAIHSANESPSKSEAGEAGASIESCVKPRPRRPSRWPVGGRRGWARPR
jgi:hypothetical protein